MNLAVVVVKVILNYRQVTVAISPLILATVIHDQHCGFMTRTVIHDLHGSSEHKGEGRVMCL